MAERTDALSAIFKDGLFHTKKNPNRDWMPIALRAGDDVYAYVCEAFQHPEVGLCGLIEALAEVILCQQDQGKRAKLIKAIPDALDACIDNLSKLEDEEPYECEEEDFEEGEESESQEDVDDVKSARVSMAPRPVAGGPGGPLPGPEEDEDADVEDNDPNESFLEAPPSKLAGFKPNPKKREKKD